ncbi:MAG TPA: VWA domain-containing protein [Labilithrix sp.]|nr:VWA domain-containing protein [Labilithrix sp.]
MSTTLRRSSSLALLLPLAAVACGSYRDAAKAPFASAAYPPPRMEAPIAQAAPEPTGTERFDDYGVNPFVDANTDRLSTFSIDVDTASYSFARRKLLRESTLPPFASVRAEEFLNSFDYGYASPAAHERVPFKVHFAASPSPFAPGHHLLRIGVQAKRISAEERQPVHLVYLVDTSGSMSAPDRLPLAKKSLALLTDTLKPGDTVALCTYAGSTRVVLEPTGIDQKAKILAGIARLDAGGGTAMASGVQLAYDLASKTLVKGHLNRVVVLSDGDANIGSSNHEQLLQTIAQHKDKGITLSTVGFGSGNYKDTMMEQLADKGDGNYTYIDGEDEARKVFTEQVDGLLQVVARDVKIQVELDPNVIARYRLVGYENRDIADKDFRNDKVDAGEVGAGHSVTALYDVELAGGSKALRTSPLVVRMRHKPAKNALHGGSDEAIESRFPMPASAMSSSFAQAPESFRLAVAVGAFAEILRKSPHAAEWRLEDVERIAASTSQGRKDRTELVLLVQTASKLSGRSVAIAR